MNNRTYIWQDQQDCNMYHVGVKFGNGKFSNWFSIYSDAIHDCFGKEVYDLIRSKVFTSPTEITLGLGFNE